MQEWQRDATELRSTDPKIVYTESEGHKTWLILTFVILWAKKIMLYTFLCLLGGTAAPKDRIKPFLIQKGIKNILKLSLTRKLLYLFIYEQLELRLPFGQSGIWFP